MAVALRKETKAINHSRKRQAIDVLELPPFETLGAASATRWIRRSRRLPRADDRPAVFLGVLRRVPDLHGRAVLLVAPRHADVNDRANCRRQIGALHFVPLVRSATIVLGERRDEGRKTLFSPRPVTALRVLPLTN